MGKIIRNFAHYDKLEGYFVFKRKNEETLANRQKLNNEPWHVDMTSGKLSKDNPHISEKEEVSDQPAYLPCDENKVDPVCSLCLMKYVEAQRTYGMMADALLTNVLGTVKCPPKKCNKNITWTWTDKAYE